jgi:type I restriction enzyme M protein
MIQILHAEIISLNLETFKTQRIISIIMEKNQSKSIFEKNIQLGLEKGLLSISEENNKITYHCTKDYIANYKNPEEKIRASYFVELIENYGYLHSKIGIGVSVPKKIAVSQADIVVYEDIELNKPYLVVECKKDGITNTEFKQAIEQVFEYANNLNAKFAAVVAGTRRTVFTIADFKPNERGKNVIADIPHMYGKAPKYRFRKCDPLKDLKTVSKEELIKALKKTHDTIWQGGKLTPTIAFDEASKLLFCKVKDERDTPINEPYKFQIGTHETPESVFARIISIYQEIRREYAEIFKEIIRLDPEIIYGVVELLQEISFSGTDLDTKIVAFDTFMKDFFKIKMGQFFTPREIIRFCVKMLDPKMEESLLDPAAGSGGFLLNAMDHVKDYCENHYDEKEAWQYLHHFATHNIYGIEINDQIARICKINMIMHGDGHTNVINADSLQNIQKIHNMHKEFEKNCFDIVLTDPPLGWRIKETKKDYLDDFELAKGKKNQNKEILFIERVIDFVRPGTGRIGIILPNWILTNTSLQYVRDFITNKCQILAIVSLPEHAFSPYGARVKPSIIFLRKKAKDERLENYRIFMAIAEHIGYDAKGRTDENELYSSDNNGTSVVAQWKIYLAKPDDYDRTQNCFSVSLSTIKREGPFNPKRYFWSPVFKDSSSSILEIAQIQYDPINPNTDENMEKDFVLIRIGDLEKNPISINSVQRGKGKDFPGNFQKIQPGDVLLARLGPSLLEKKIVVCPKFDNVDFIVASTDFIVIRPISLRDSYFIAGVCRTDLMIKYLYSKCRGSIPGRFRLDREDFKKLPFPIPDKEIRHKYAKMIQKSSLEYAKFTRKAESILENAQAAIQELIRGDMRNED